MAWEADCQNVHFGLVPLWRMNYKACAEIPIQSQVQQHKCFLDIALVHATMPPQRSEEHTSELQSHHELVCSLLLEKRKTTRSPHSYRVGQGWDIAYLRRATTS